MLWTNVKRISRTGFMNFWRNGTVSLASVLIMIVTLLVIGFILFGSAVLNTSLVVLKDKVDITVTFIPSAAETDILGIQHSLQTLPEVAAVKYTSRADVLAAFEARHQDDQSILTALNELSDNPLGAELDVKAVDPSQYQGIADFLQGKNALSASGLSIIDHINYFQNQDAINKLTTIIHAADKLGLGIALAFILLSIIISFNTLRLTIYMSREEISVMRLVGASKAYIQGPFVVVGMIYGLVASIATLFIFLPVTYWIGKVTTDFFIGLNLFTYYLHNFPEVFLILVGSGIIIGAFSSSLAVRRYLKV
jgi:cell division transport system permease protein